MNEHTQAMLEFAAIVAPLFAACFVGIIGLYSRLTRIETKLDPLWSWFMNGRNKNKEEK